MKKQMKTIKLVVDIITWIFVAFAVAITVLVLSAQADADGVPSVNGNCMINIITNSMDGDTMKKGDLIISKKPTDTQRYALAVNDIISYWTDIDGNGTLEINTHRIVEIEYDAFGYVNCYYTQGDNRVTNPVRDEDPVFPKDVICVYTGTRFSGFGNFLNFIQTQTGFFFVIILPLIAFFVYELVKFIMTLSNVRESDKKLSAAEEEEIKQRAIAEYLRQQAEEKAKAEAEAAEGGDTKGE